jgi:hypothetical protein
MGQRQKLGQLMIWTGQNLDDAIAVQPDPAVENGGSDAINER